MVEVPSFSHPSDQSVPVCLWQDVSDETQRRVSGVSGKNWWTFFVDWGGRGSERWGDAPKWVLVSWIVVYRIRRSLDSWKDKTSNDIVSWILLRTLYYLRFVYNSLVTTYISHIISLTLRFNLKSDKPRIGI